MKELRKLPIILVGISIYTFGLVAFILPGKLIMGGGTGLSIFLNHYFHLPIELFLAVINTILFLIGFAVMGKKFAFTTLVSTIFFPISLGFMQKMESLHAITTEPLLSTIYGGLSIGIGLGIVLKAGASTGGLDIPVIILNKKKKIPMSLSFYVIDVSILIAQMSYSDKNGILYGIILVMVYSIVIDKVLTLGAGTVKVEVISHKYEEINDMIQKKINRGTTLLEGSTGFKNRPTKVVISAVDKRELNGLVKEIEAIDKSAFTIVHQVSRISGTGF